ncbi:cystinosin-like [Chironomus tepperi]|uniref:cystinosin-like n=1 Tax=Chironomus tepperi TaxID=113505 RepID=UPI00391FBCF8
MTKMNVSIFFVIFLAFLCLKNVESESLPEFDISWTSKTVIVGESHEIFMNLVSSVPRGFNVSFVEDQEDLLDWSPKQISVAQNAPNSNFTIKLDIKKAGSVEVTGTSSPKNVIDDFNLFFKIKIGNSRGLIIASVIVGWVYFVAWSISFYPQVVINFRRKSVVGLSFDFLALNIFGHTSYAIFNSCLYFLKYFQDEYFLRFPHGQNPVELNDVFFSIHASFLTAFTIFQCFIYERGVQRVSYIAWSLIGIFIVTIIVVIIICSIGTLHWLDFLYTLSYIKLAVTLTKYIPQAVLNYRRKSTVGWSIENIILDLTGGVLSMMQMFFNSYNYDDWQSNFGNPTKLGLALFSIFFDLIFIVQHYVLYKDARHAEDNKAESTEVTIEPEQKQ